MAVQDTKFTPTRRYVKNITDRINAEIDSWQVQCFATFMLTISTEWVQSNWFRFSIEGEKRTYSTYEPVWDQLDDCIEVGEGNCSQPIESFLDMIYADYSSRCDSIDTLVSSDVVEVKFSHQRAWWRSNGKHFRLMNLPAEVRNLIYKYTLGQGAFVPITALYRSHGYKKSQYISGRLRAPDVALVKVSRQLYHEVSAILYWDVNFVISTVDTLKVVLKNPCAKYIQKLTLDFDILEYLDLFGMSIAEQTSFFDGRFDNGTADGLQIGFLHEATPLKKMRLRLLILNFTKPLDRPFLSRLNGARHNPLCRHVLSRALRAFKGQPVEAWGWIDDQVAAEFRIETAIARRDFLDWYDPESKTQNVVKFQKWYRHLEGSNWHAGQKWVSPHREREWKRFVEEMEAKAERKELVIIKNEMYPIAGYYCPPS